MLNLFIMTDKLEYNVSRDESHRIHTLFAAKSLYRLKFALGIPELNCALSIRSKPPQILLEHTLAEIKSSVLPSRIVLLKQIHSCIVHKISNRDDIERFNGIEGDALITDLPDVGLCVSVADCAPIILADKVNKAIALIHAGWRGIDAGIVEHCVEILFNYGAKPREIFAYIGPTIGKKDYEVDSKFLELFPDSTQKINDKFFFDIPAEIKRKLAMSGIENVYIFPYSTKDSMWLHSYRRDGIRAGRNLIVIWKNQSRSCL